MKHSLKYIIPCLVATLSLASCDDWTKVESLDIVDPIIENSNPELYEQYLSNLRQFKATKHKKTYAWFDNSVKNTYSRSQHVSDVPDSVDVISLMSPADIMTTELAEINQVREQKGTRFIYDIDFDAIRADYSTYVEELAATDEEAEPIAFSDFLLNAFSTQLSYIGRYGFDGIHLRKTRARRTARRNIAEGEEFGDHIGCEDFFVVAEFAPIVFVFGDFDVVERRTRREPILQAFEVVKRVRHADVADFPNRLLRRGSQLGLTRRPLGKPHIGALRLGRWGNIEWHSCPITLDE